MTFWAKAYLAEAGICAGDLAKYRYLDSKDDVAKNAGPLPDASDLGNPFSDMTSVEAVVDGFYDAAVATEKRFLQVAATQKLVLLSRFSDTASLLVGRSKLPASTARSFQLAMINIKDPQILQTFPGYPSGFKLCTDKDFAQVLKELPSESKFDEKSFTDQ